MKKVIETVRLQLIVYLIFQLILPPALFAQQAHIPGFYGSAVNLPQINPNTLPEVKTDGLLQGVAGISNPVNNRLVIHQNQPRAIIDWQHFNIGQEAWTHFDQRGNTNWAALNRIYDRNPSLIFGKLTADGQVYLINQNGILFGEGSQIDVHALTAASLNIKDSDFLGGVLQFRSENYIDPGEPSDSRSGVSNFGRITTDSLGSVFLLGRNVENAGIIDTPVGQIGLAAGSEVAVDADSTSNSTRSAKVVNVLEDPGQVSNLTGGRMNADNGLIGMYGKMVNQEGVVRAVTAIKKAGKIELHASEKIVTGPNSETSTPISASTEKVNESFPYSGGEITLQGLDPQFPLFPRESVDFIVHQGRIEAPSGTVNLKAEKRLFMENGSNIDVSGAWLDKPADEKNIDIQLNSVQMRDDFGQKDGLLNGQTLSFNALYGSAIGDISSSISVQEMTALERSTDGGEIFIEVNSGDLIQKSGGSIDFSGGGIRYGQGLAETTKLLSGQKAYDSSNAPQWITYDRVLNQHSKISERYGIMYDLNGLYCGGATPIKDYIFDHVEGANAGELSLIAKQIVLDGNLDGSVTTGPYQNLEEELFSSSGKQMTRGRKAPIAGGLILGDQPLNQSPELLDMVVDRVEIHPATAALSADFGPQDALPPTDSSDLNGDTLLTMLSAERINDWNLGHVQVNTNTSCMIAPGAIINLAPGGSFDVNARLIAHYGEVTVPAGNIGLKIVENVTSLNDIQGSANPRHIPLQNMIYIGDGSRLSVAGQSLEVISPSSSDESAFFPLVRKDGGIVSLTDQSAVGGGIFAKSGALIDVSGGWVIDGGGEIAGGDAGSLNVTGSTIALDAELSGHSLLGNRGGSIALHTERVIITDHAPVLNEAFSPQSEIPAEMENRLAMQASRLEKTGFTSVKLNAVDDIILEPGSGLTPSQWKLGYLNRVDLAHAATAERIQADSAAMDQIGSTSFSLKAGIPLPGLNLDGSQREANISAAITMGRNSFLQTGPNGSVALDAPQLQLAGVIQAPAGEISLKSRQGDITLLSGTQLIASGCVVPEIEPVMVGYPLGSVALDAGSVTIDSSRDILFEPGAMIDVSGSMPVNDCGLAYVSGNLVPSFAGGSMPQAVKTTSVGVPGSISFTYLENLSLEGELRGHSTIEGFSGAELSFVSKKTDASLQITNADLNDYIAAGFDDISFTSWKALEFTDPTGRIDAWVPRHLTLDAPELCGSDDTAVDLASAWITMTNSYAPATGAATGGTARLAIEGGWIDVDGSVMLSGFSDVRLIADHDIRFSDRYYQPQGQAPLWEGRLSVPGNLTLEAARVFPTTSAEFTVSVADTLVTLPGSGEVSGDIYSAGGMLAIEAADIDHQGAIFAPMGQISLTSTRNNGRIYLAGGSRLSTNGSLQVKYGDLDESYWLVTDKENNTQVNVETPPDKGISLKADEVIIRKEALVDASGGGSIFSYQFLPGADGSNDPLKKSGRYIIVTDSTVQMPGQAVYINENAFGLQSGTYILLPEEYAFLPGAITIEATGNLEIPGSNTFTKEGFPLVSGYFADFGTDARSSNIQSFSMRPAASLFTEGFFNKKESFSGDGGVLSFTGKTTIMDGIIQATPWAGYQGGSLKLVGSNIRVLKEAPPLPDGFGFASSVPDALSGTLNVTTKAISGRGFRQIDLGSTAVTDTLTVEAEARLDASSLTLEAKNEIAIEQGAQISTTASGNNSGSLSLYSPTGRVSLAENAHLKADRELNIHTRELNLQGDFAVSKNGAFNLEADAIFIVPDNYAPTSPGVYLEERFWNRFGDIASVSFRSLGDMFFAGDIDLEAGETMTLDAARLVGYYQGGSDTASMSADTVNILNTGAIAGTDSSAADGRLIVNANAVNLGRGSTQLEGFAGIEINASSDVTTIGKGSLTSSGDLKINAARLTAVPSTDRDNAYETADFHIEATGQTFDLNQVNGVTGNSLPGGKLAIKADDVNIAGTLDLLSGVIVLEAQGTGVFLKDTAKILARGSDLASAGRVDLYSQTGTVLIDDGALIDVSAGQQGDAGAINLSAPQGGVALTGPILGADAGGLGGSLSIDTYRLDDMAATAQLAAAGGFTEVLEFRARSGGLSISNAQTIRARSIKLAADTGNINVDGSIDASGTNGGTIAILAGMNLNLNSNSHIDARGTDAAGGHVMLASSDGEIIFSEGGTIDVTGHGSGRGGIVSWRAPQLGDDIRLSLNGTITGPSAVYAEAFRVYTADSINSVNSDVWRTDAQNFMNTAAAIENRLLAGLNRQGWEALDLHLLPGIEVRAPGDLALTENWDLSSWRFGGEPGALTLRAEGNLNINASLVDHPTTLNSLTAGVGRDSWELNLIAGSDTTAANPLEFIRGTGELRIAEGQMVYTESAPLRFASGLDTVIGSSAAQGYMIDSGIRYSLGTFDGGITGKIGRDLIIAGGAIQAATGDIDIEVGRDLVLKVSRDFGSGSSFTSLGSIRTTGQPITTASEYWTYGDGGNISLYVNGSVAGTEANDAWDFAYGQRSPKTWAASYEKHNATEGLATMGGGDLNVRAEGSFFTQAGTFGKGNLEIVSNGDIVGRFLVKEGKGRVIGMGAVGLENQPVVFEAFDANIIAGSVGDINLGAVVNPTIAREQFTGAIWQLNYSQNASVSLISSTGDVHLYGDSQYYNLGTSQARLERIMPPTLEVHAARDILISNELALAPSPIANLVLEAGRDIDGQYFSSTGTGTTQIERALISMADMDPAEVYGLLRNPPIADFFSRYMHSESMLQARDRTPISITAGQDIQNMQFILPKQVEFESGRDVRDIYYIGQNIHPEDMSTIQAGRDIFFSTRPGSNYATGIQHGGPGTLYVAAGNSVDLGTTQGISTFGNAFNPALGSKGSELVLIAGYNLQASLDDMVSFFDDLREGGVAYSTLQAEGALDGSQMEIDRIRREIITPVLDEGGKTGSGTIDMTSSQISTVSGADSIYVIAAGDMNVGRTTFIAESERQNTGIFTAAGGSINIFTAEDINVNESRVMTFRGGNITAWSDQGSINAGRGSKTAVSVDPPKVELIGDQYVLVFRPPSVGSGIRALTYDPDGIEGPLPEPETGDIYAFAPRGVIDAGEAGIAGGNVTLGATEVLNAQNIEVAGVSVGIPQTTTGPSMGAMVGAGTVSETSKIVEESAAMKSAEERFSERVADLSEQLVPKWIAVEVIGFEATDTEK